jgi:hypothetical protein
MEEETHNALENNGRKNRSTRAPPWLLRMKNGKLHNVKAYSYNLDLEMV